MHVLVRLRRSLATWLIGQMPVVSDAGVLPGPAHPRRQRAPQGSGADGVSGDQAPAD